MRNFRRSYSKCIKYLSALNIIHLANHIVGNNFVPAEVSNTDADFENLFKWKTLKDGFQEAKAVQKPIFVLIHKPLCPSCVKLKEKFSKSMRLMDLSDRFVMVKAEMGSDCILDKKEFQPDGVYVPRILFFTSDGEFIRGAYNKHETADKDHKYFYQTPTQIAETMLYVLKQYSKEPLPLTYRHGQSLRPESCDVDSDVIGPTLLH